VHAKVNESGQVRPGRIVDRHFNGSRHGSAKIRADRRKPLIGKGSRYNLPMQIVNIAAYRFVPVADPARLRAPLKQLCQRLELKGTILLAPEGVNLFVAGVPEAIEQFLLELDQDELYRPVFGAITVKRSPSDKQPFRRMLVKLKKEIITMRHPAIVPAEGRAPAVTAARLREWLERGRDDDGREVVLLDTRNAFEVALGTFEGALDFNLTRFTQFPDAYHQAVADKRIDPTTQHIVTFCTGGIRCEKAALYMQEQGAGSVTQLEGGILKYFEEVGGEHYRGECFVFDDRVALDAELKPTATVQCYACRAVVTPEQQLDARYQIGASCPQCHSTRHATLVE
jgi:UPF0176 protein